VWELTQKRYKGQKGGQGEIEGEREWEMREREMGEMGGILLQPPYTRALQALHAHAAAEGEGEGWALSQHATQVSIRYMSCIGYTSDLSYILVILLLLLEEASLPTCLPACLPAFLWFSVVLGYAYLK